VRSVADGAGRVRITPGSTIPVVQMSRKLVPVSVSHKCALEFTNIQGAAPKYNALSLWMKEYKFVYAEDDRVQRASVIKVHGSIHKSDLAAFDALSRQADFDRVVEVILVLFWADCHASHNSY
jgi:hypothetical protein